MARLKLTYEDVRAVNPKIIYVGAYGFSQRGPYAAKPAYDDLIQGMVALPSIIEQAGADRPRFVPSTVADRITGLNAVNAVTTALFQRERTGRGQAVEVTMFECLVPVRAQRSHGRQDFRAADRSHGLSAPACRASQSVRDPRRLFMPADLQRQAVAQFLPSHRPRRHFRERPRFATQADSLASISAQVYAFVADHIKTRTSADWLDVLTQADIPAMPLNSLEDLLADPHLNETGFFSLIDHPSEGTLRSMGVPSQWSDSTRGCAAPGAAARRAQRGIAARSGLQRRRNQGDDRRRHHPRDGLSHSWTSRFRQSNSRFAQPSKKSAPALTPIIG